VILSDVSIRGELQAGELRIDPPPTPIRIQPASIDLSIGEEIKWANGMGVKITQGDGFRLHPRKFVLGHTQEYVRVPAHLVAQLNGKSSLGRRGLLVHSTAGYIDPGFQGHITLELCNIGHEVIYLELGMLIAQLILIQLTKPCERPYGHPDLNSHYQGQIGATLAHS